MRTPNKLIAFASGDGMLAKCNNYYIEKPATDLQYETRYDARAIYQFDERLFYCHRTPYQDG